MNTCTYDATGTCICPYDNLKSYWRHLLYARPLGRPHVKMVNVNVILDGSNSLGKVMSYSISDSFIFKLTVPPENYIL